jgi:hypothetical protein
MIVALCGAYRNCGDHLIGMRARALLRSYVEDDIITLDRKALTEDHYALFKRARAVVLCGGPAYQREMYPKVYALERERVKAPIRPLGLGWKSPAGKSPASFKFGSEAAAFINDIHARIPFSSARDPLTVEVLSHAGVKNVSMTGCPAWYDLARVERDYAHCVDVGRLVMSMPAIMQPGVVELLAWLTQRFPKARRVVSFHHGLAPSSTGKGRETGREFVAFAREAKRQDWEIRGLASSLAQMERLYGETDLHIGYRVHAHLFCLSRRTASILISEDTRGVGQCRALGAPILMTDGANIEPIMAVVDEHFSKRGETVAGSVATMQATFPKMRDFLETI